MNLLAHTHTDLFKVAMSYSNPVLPVGVLGVCGGVTTWGGQPAFCVYEIDMETLLPLNRYTYSFDMDRANKENEITWIANFTDFRRDYSL